MRIGAVDVLPYAIPLAAPLATARGALGTRVGCVVRVRTDAGLAGLGDAAPHPHAGTAALPVVHDELARSVGALRGAPVTAIEQLLDAIAARRGAAAMGLDLALHDLVARSRGITVAELLGGTPRTVATSALLGADAVASAAAAAAAGHRVAKLKPRGAADEVVREVGRIRRAAPDLMLRIDANGAWDEETARAVIRTLAPDGIEWIEQPVAAHDLTALARVRRAARGRGHAIAADEAVTGPDAVGRIADADAADVVVLKLAQVGGLRRALASARAAAAAGLGVVVTTGIDTGIGTAAALHLAAALASGAAGDARLAARDAGLATAGLLAGDVVRAPVAPAALFTPAGPGLGVELDERALARFAAPCAEVA